MRADLAASCICSCFLFKDPWLQVLASIFCLHGGPSSPAKMKALQSHLISFFIFLLAMWHTSKISSNYYVVTLVQFVVTASMFFHSPFSLFLCVCFVFLAGLLGLEVFSCFAFAPCVGTHIPIEWSTCTGAASWCYLRCMWPGPA